jgi:uncharacterized protein DUF6023
MSSERGRGVLLYLLFAVLLAGGGVWFFRSEPASTSDPRIAVWRDSAANLLPDRPLEVRADTIVMTADSSTQRTEAVGGGSYTLSMVCLGESGRIRVRLSTSGDDSGRGVPCARAPQLVAITVGLADDFFMEVSAETDGSIAVFRWRLDHARGF